MMRTLFDSFTPEAAGRVVDLLVRSQMAEDGGEDYAQAYREVLPDLPDGLARAYAGRGPIDVERVRRNLVALARHLARESGKSVTEELERLLADEFKELAIVYYTGEVG